MTERARSHRCAVLMGPYATGKTSLFEALLHRAGAIDRKGSVPGGTTLGDAAADARARQMSIDPNIADLSYLGEDWTIVDAPGSVELTTVAQACAMVADMVVVVVEPEPERAVTVAPILRFLDAHKIPHVLFVNKMDKATATLRDLTAALQRASTRPLVLREVPIREGDRITGHVDLVSERAYRWRENESSDLVALPDTVRERQTSARQEMLETLADFDDALLEQLLEEHQPAPAEIFEQIARDVADDLVVPVFFGSAEHGNGILRLLKTLRHDAPGPDAAARRLGVGGAAATVFRIQHLSHLGRTSLVRLWREMADGATVNGQRISGLYRMIGPEARKIAIAPAGAVVGLGRVEGTQAGHLVMPDGSLSRVTDWPTPPPPVDAVAIAPVDRKDEVKLTASLARLVEEDPGYSTSHSEATGQLVLHGQGEIHLQIAVERLGSRFNVALVTSPTTTAYRETIRGRAPHHARFKRQTGGHGQFADIKIEVRPTGRGEGFVFENRIVGGAIPKNFIAPVETGLRDGLAHGPLGFPVVDVAVTLVDGQFHAVDSSDMAFRTVASQAMGEVLPTCQPVLLEPIHAVTIRVPQSFTAKVHAIISGRRGQILGMDVPDGWDGWDEIQCLMPEAEMHGLIVELRSATLGVGGFTSRFDHLQELTGRLAEQVVDGRKRASAA